jgi:hypothetical protein
MVDGVERVRAIEQEHAQAELGGDAQHAVHGGSVGVEAYPGIRKVHDHGVDAAQ